MGFWITDAESDADLDNPECHNVYVLTKVKAPKAWVKPATYSLDVIS